MSRQGKEVEINVKDAAINKADLPPISQKRKQEAVRYAKQQGYTKRKKKHNGKSDDNRKSKSRYDNDVMWYKHYPELFDNITRVNPLIAVGSKLQLYKEANLEGYSSYNATAAGVLTVTWIPTFGSMERNIESPVNRVANQLYQAMRIELGSRADYDITDTMLYTLTMDSAFILYSVMVKIYGMLNAVSPFNYYTLQPMFTANGVNYSSFATNMSNYRALINQFAIGLSKYLVPSEFDLFKRHIFLSQYIFTDSNTAKAQYYSFMPAFIYKLVEMTTGDKQLQPLTITDDTGSITYSSLYNAMNTILLSLDSSQDISQMSADIAKAFKDKTVLLNFVPENYQLEFAYSQEVLCQLENMILLGDVVHNATVDPIVRVDLDLQYSDGPRLYQNLWLKPGITISGSNELAESKVVCNAYLNSNINLNFHWNDISNDDAMIATRGLPRVIRSNQVADTNFYSLQIGARGSEIFLKATMSMLLNSGLLSQQQYVSIMPVSKTSTTAIDHEDMLETISLWSQFDWAPHLSYVNFNSDKISRMQDIDMFCQVSDSQLEEMHACAILSEFYSEKYPSVMHNRLGIERR